jgi:hypothetical protein
MENQHTASTPEDGEGDKKRSAPDGEPDTDQEFRRNNSRTRNGESQQQKKRAFGGPPPGRSTSRPRRSRQAQAPPESYSWKEFKAKEIPRPKLIIPGVLFAGHKMSIGGSSKMGKSWILVHLALALATGKSWIGLPVSGPCKVFYINFEILEHCFRQRFEIVCSHLEFDDKDETNLGENLTVWTLRGYPFKLEEFFEAVQEEIADRDFDCIIVDPYYKLAIGKDENAAGDMGEVLNEFDKIATRCGAALVYAVHFAKGSQAGKDPIDRVSGSGVLARDPDVFITFTNLDDEDCYQRAFVLRDFPRRPMDSVRWNPDKCLMEPAPGVDPSKVRKPGTTNRKYTVEQILKILGDARLTSGSWEARCNGLLGMVRSTFNALKKEALGKGLIRRCPEDLSKWERVK